MKTLPNLVVNTETIAYLNQLGFGLHFCFLIWDVVFFLNFKILLLLIQHMIIGDSKFLMFYRVNLVGVVHAGTGYANRVLEGDE